LALSGVVIAFLVIGCSRAETMYFVGSGPIVPYYMGPFGVVVYKVDSECDSLRKVWNLPQHDYYFGVMPYPSERVLIVVAEPWGYTGPDRLYIVPFDSVSSVQSPVLDFRGTSQTLSGWQYVDNGDGRSFLRVCLSPAAPGTDEKIIDLSTFKVADPSVLSRGATTRLVRSGNTWYRGSVETRQVNLNLWGDQWEPTDSEVESNSAPIPDSIVQMKTSFGWSLIANEPKFYVLQSIPDRNGLTSRELLIFNRSSGIWHSMLIPGPVTKLRLFGCWLGGVVTDDNPETDYEKHVGFTPVSREDLALINPVELRLFTVRLGEWCELLSIESDVVFYKIHNELYRARIQDGDFVDRQLILKDMQVSGMLWAFSGRDCSPIPEPSHPDSLRLLRRAR